MSQRQKLDSWQGVGSIRGGSEARDWQNNAGTGR